MQISFCTFYRSGESLLISPTKFVDITDIEDVSEENCLSAALLYKDEEPLSVGIKVLDYYKVMVTLVKIPAKILHDLTRFNKQWQDLLRYDASCKI